MSAGFSVCDSVLQEEMGNLSNVPEEYLDLKEVFSKSSQVKSSHLYLYSAFNNTNCNKALHNIKIGKFVNNVK